MEARLIFSIVILLFNIQFRINAKPLINEEETCNNNCRSNLEEKLWAKLTKRPSQKQICKFCDLTLPIVRYLIDKNETSHFHEIISFGCVQLKLADKTVCDLIVKTYQMAVLNIVSSTQLSSKELCSVALACTVIDNPIYTWNISLPNVPKPPIKPLELPKPGSPTVRILQLSDIHIDFEYQPGALADCNQPLCCRNNSFYANNIYDERSAGYWGDYRNCDIPVWTVENMFEHISKNEKFDFIYWTGDLPPHNVWNQTRSDQLKALEKLTQLFQKYFPNKSIFPTLGNHETQPCNLYPTPYVKTDKIDWLYSALSREWTKTGLPDYLSANISNGAFYTLLLYPNLRLISLNTNYCPKENFWLIINSTDPLGQLDWLSKTLQESEDNNEKVHIIGHIDPSQCLDSWSANYYRIINRYESIIVAQIFGHSHRDQFNIFYDLNNNTRAINVAYLGPSVTTVSYLNPGYKIYTVDGAYKDSSWQVLDFDTMYLNLTEANLFNVTKWRTEYSAREAYNLENLFPQTWSELIDTMLNNLDSSLSKKIYKYYSKSSDKFPECDKICMKNLLCGFKQARSDRFIKCI